MRQGGSKRTLVSVAALCVLLVEASASADMPATRPATAGPSVAVDRPALVGAVGDQTALAAAHVGGGTFVAVWRTALWEGEVRAARIPPAGPLPEPRGILLPGLGGTDAQPTVAASAGRVLVVSTAEGNVQATLLATDPDLLPGPAVTLASAGGAELGRPVVVWQDALFWVAWSQSGRGVLALPVTEQGVALATSPVQLSATAGPVALAPDIGATIAIWSEAPPVGGDAVALRGLRLGAFPSGGFGIIDPGPFELGSIPGTRAGPVAIASNPARFLVAAAAERVGSAPGAAVVSTVSTVPFLPPHRTGGLLPLEPMRPLAEFPGALSGGPSVAWTGSAFLVLWSEAGATAADTGVRTPGAPDGRLVTARGLVSELPLPGLGAAGEQPVAVTGADQPLVFVARPPGGRGDLDIRGMRLGPTGGVEGSDFLVSAGVNWQGNPALAAADLPAGERPRLLLAWEDARADRLSADVFVSALDGQAAPMAPEATALATGPADQRAPAVAWDGKGYQVVWREQGRGLMAARVGPDGAILDRPPLLVPGSGGRQTLSDPALCGDRSGAVLVFGARVDRGPSVPAVAELRVVRIAPGGTVRDEGSLAFLTTHDVSTPPSLRLACSADGALLVWTGLHDMDRSGLPDLYLSLIPRRGEVGSPRVTLLEDGAAEEGPAVASDGRGFLVVWRPRQVGGARVAVVGTRVDAAGVGLDNPARELGSLNAGHRLSVHWDGWQWVLAGMQSLGVGEFQLRARRVRADLGALDPDWFPVDIVSSRRGTGAFLAAAGLGGGAAVLGFEAFPEDDATGNQRLRARRLVTPALDPAAAVDAADAGAGPDAAGPRALAGVKARGGCACTIGEPAAGSDHDGGVGGQSALAVIALLALLHRRRQRVQ